MARDYKGRASPKSKRQSSPWLPFAAGVLVGAVAVGLAWYRLTPVGTPLQWQEVVPASITEPESSEPEPVEEIDEPRPKPRFDFYTILPEQEVVVSDDEVAPPPRAETGAAAKPKPAAAAVKESYLLQVGSFRKLKDADSLRAKLALIGIEADIQKVSIRDGDIFHRVRTGPYHSKQDLNDARARLKENGISNIVVRLKK